MSNKQLTVKEEKFAQVFVETGNASKAYRIAYDVEDPNRGGIGVDAFKVLRRPHVAARVDELRAEQKDLWRVSIETLVNELEEAKDHALKDPKGAAAAVAAINAKAKLVGLAVDRIETKNETKLDLASLSEEDLAKLAEILGRG